MMDTLRPVDSVDGIFHIFYEEVDSSWRLRFFYGQLHHRLVHMKNMMNKAFDNVIDLACLRAWKA